MHYARTCQLVLNVLSVQDWWTCIDFQTFYRKWNYVVYDWIHAYFYRDLKLVWWNKTHTHTTTGDPLSSICKCYFL